ncbi:hypothetical protein BDW75DRAFT_103017 [Aspergillus navahoensis]
MRKFVKFLGGDKNAGSYHSIWAVPAPESGSRLVVTNTKKEKTKQTRETLSTKKPDSTVHISKLNQPSVAELSSPTTSVISAPRGRESLVELSATTEAQVSELDGWSPTAHTGVPTDVRKHRDGERAPANSTPRPTTGPDADILIFSDATDGIPLFGRQFGIAPTSIIREQKVMEPELEPCAEPQPEPAASLRSPEAFFQQVDEELEALYTDYLKSSGKQQASVGQTKTVKKARKSKPSLKPRPEACIICLEPFSEDGVSAPNTLSIACQHTPSVCYICLSKSIKHDLETKFWDEIKCPECQTLFIHEDIKRFADEETFNRYDRLSFRHVLNADKNFIWCLECNFGQLHESGAEQPLVQCFNCSAESCFKHAIKWHDGFTCDEYDAVLWDPDSYKAIREKNGGNSRPNVEYLSKKDMQRAMKKEQTRQNKLHEAQKKAALKRQEEEAARVCEKKALEQAQAEAAQRQEDEEIIEVEVKDDFKEKIEMLKRRMREVELSMKKVEETTKRCPGCQWPIEKNDGCDHMTCIKCRAEFCWICLGGWSSHTRRCR